MIVKNNPWVVWEWFFSIKLWWAHVTVTPEDKRMAVFNKGIWNGLKIYKIKMLEKNYNEKRLKKI